MTPITRPMTSSLTSLEIPITQPYPDVIVDLRGLGLELGLGLGLGLELRVDSLLVTWGWGVLRTGPPLTSCLSHHWITSAFSLVIVYAGRPLLTSSCLHHHWLNYASSSSIFSCCVIPIFTILRHHVKRYKKGNTRLISSFISRTASATRRLLTGKQQHGRTKQSSAYWGTLP